MAVFSSTSIAICFGILAIYLVTRLIRSKDDGLPLPPGPQGAPLLGNINDLPKPGVLEAHHWLEHKDKYGM